MELESTEKPLSNGVKPANRLKFIIGGALIVAAIIFLIISSSQANGQYYLTIEELQSKGQSMVGKEVRISGAVLGDTIQYDGQNMVVTFTVANVSADNAEIEAEGGLAAALHNAVTDPSRARLDVVYNNVKPDLLKDEAQAIMTGTLDENGVFHANELLLKCPTKYESSLPDQAE